MTNLRKVIFALRILLGLFFFSLSLLAISAPVIQTVIGYPNGEGIYSLLSPICHQYPTRSFWILDRPFALCSRCFSGYLGLSIGFLLISYKATYYKRFLWGVTYLIPGVLDGLLQLWTSYESTNIMRFFTGLSGGVGIFFIIYPFKSYSINKKGKMNETDD